MIEYIGKCLFIKEKDEKGKEEKIVVIGDLHLGYEEALLKSGISVGRTLFDEIINEMNEIFDKVGRVDKVILLGDVKHVFSGNIRQEWDDALNIFDWLLKKTSEIIITKGNHDNYLMTIAGKRNIRVSDYYVLNRYCFLHGNRDYEQIKDKKIKYWIMGHGHPAINISDGKKREKYKCFLIGKYKDKKIIILPSFFGANEGSDIKRYEMKMAWNFNYDDFEVKIVGDKLEALDFGKLKNIN